MRIFVTNWFDRFAARERIFDEHLFDAIMRAEKGLIDAKLGGGLIKQRIGRSQQGKSGGYRTIIVFKADDRAIFVFGFAKNDRSNISPSDLVRLKQLSDFYFSKTSQDLVSMANRKALREIKDGKDNL